MKARPYKAEHGTRWTEVYCITCAEWIPEDEFGPHEGVHAKSKRYSAYQVCGRDGYMCRLKGCSTCGETSW